MNFYSIPNYLLEAMVYLGYRANRIDPSMLEKRLQKKGVEDLSAFRKKNKPFAELRGRLDQEVHIQTEKLEKLFKDLPGFQYNTSGAFSLAFLLLFPMVEEYHNDLEQFLRQMDQLTPDQVARNLLVSLDLTDNLGPNDEGCSAMLMDAVLNMNAPPESRLAILDAHHNYRDLIREAGEYLRPVLSALEHERIALNNLAEQVYQEFMVNGVENSLCQITSVTLRPEMEYHLRPLILCPDTNLFMDVPQENSMLFYCGALRLFLIQQVETFSGNATQIYEAVKLLGDRTRFDIVCYLKQHPAYGQELSNHFGLARNTIHHHMSKLLDAGLVTCTVDGNRVYYAINDLKMHRLITQLSNLFVGGE